METKNPRVDESAGTSTIFPTTIWATVVTAGNRDASVSFEALGSLCQRYWYPLYAYARHCGQPHEAAEDAVQGFFGHFLQKGLAGHADPNRGRFRSFLLSCFQNHLRHDWKASRALKRGGENVPVSWDAMEAEERYRHEQPIEPASPEEHFDRRFAREMIQASLAKLREEFVAEGQEQRFEVLKEYLTAEAPAQGEAAARLGLTGGALKTAVHRLRHRFRELFRQELAETVATPSDLNEELRYLTELLAKGE